MESDISNVLERRPTQSDVSERSPMGLSSPYRLGSWPPKSKRALGKNTLTFQMACMFQTTDKYPELLYEE